MKVQHGHECCRQVVESAAEMLYGLIHARFSFHKSYTVVLQYYCQIALLLVLRVVLYSVTEPQSSAVPGVQCLIWLQCPARSRGGDNLTALIPVPSGADSFLPAEGCQPCWTSIGKSTLEGALWPPMLVTS